MPYPFSLEQNLSPRLNQSGALMMTPQMQQAIHLLQLPLLELSQAIEEEVEQNPVLEYLQEEEEEEEDRESGDVPPEKEMVFDDRHLEILQRLDEEFRDLFADSGPFIPKRSSEEDKRQVFLDSLVEQEPSLSEYLMKQAREEFSDPQDLKIAEILLGYIDARGFLETPVNEIAATFSLNLKQVEKVLKKIQTFDPIGIASKNIKEVLLAQLSERGLRDSLAYKMIKEHFIDLLHNRLPNIQKAMHVPMKEIRSAIENEIAKLNFHPGAAYFHIDAPTLVPDVRLRQEGDEVAVEANEDLLRPLCINRKYLRMLEEENISKETKDFIRTKIFSAKWLMKNIHQRSETLTRIAVFLVKYQKPFFISSKGNLKPLIMKTMADELSLHESTIARAIANKYIETPRGIFPFRYFFSNAYVDAKGEDISAKTVIELMMDIIAKEDKQKPLSDEKISEEISLKGVQCARRTVAKYRRKLGIEKAQQRKLYT